MPWTQLVNGLIPNRNPLYSDEPSAEGAKRLAMYSTAMSVPAALLSTGLTAREVMSKHPSTIHGSTTEQWIPEITKAMNLPVGGMKIEAAKTPLAIRYSPPKLTDRLRKLVGRGGGVNLTDTLQVYPHGGPEYTAKALALKEVLNTPKRQVAYQGRLVAPMAASMAAGALAMGDPEGLGATVAAPAIAGLGMLPELSLDRKLTNRSKDVLHKITLAPSEVARGQQRLTNLHRIKMLGALMPVASLIGYNQYQRHKKNNQGLLERLGF